MRGQAPKYFFLEPTLGILANYQTGFDYKFTHDPIQRVEFVNAPKLYSSVTIERDKPKFSSS